MPDFEQFQKTEIANLESRLERSGWQEHVHDLRIRTRVLYQATCNRVGAETAGAGHDDIADAWQQAQGHGLGLAAWIHDTAALFVRTRGRLPRRKSPAASTRALVRRKGPGTKVRVNLEPETGKLTFRSGNQRHEIKLPVDKPFAVVAHLAAHREKRYTAEQIIEKLWPVEAALNPHTVDVHLTNFRKALKSKGGAWALLADRIKSRNGRKFIDLSPRNDED